MKRPESEIDFPVAGRIGIEPQVCVRRVMTQQLPWRMWPICMCLNRQGMAKHPFDLAAWNTAVPQQAWPVVEKADDG